MFRHLTSCLLGNLSRQCFMSSLSSHCNRFHLPALLDSLTKEFSVPKCHQNWFKLWFSNLLQKEMILSSSGSSRGYGRIKDDGSAEFWNVVKHWISCWSGGSSGGPRRCQGREEQRTTWNSWTKTRSWTVSECCGRCCFASLSTWRWLEILVQANCTCCPEETQRIEGRKTTRGSESQ